MTPQQYYDALAHFDWDYPRSDDHGVYLRGIERERELRNLSTTDKRLERIWENFREFRLGLTQKKPRRPK